MCNYLKFRKFDSVNEYGVSDAKFDTKAARSRTYMWARVSSSRLFTDTNVYGAGSVKIWNILHKIVSVDIRIFLQCTEASVLRSRPRVYE